MRYSNENKQKKNGAIFTPTDMAVFVAQKMVNYKTPDNIISILDPAVGEGELIVALINALIPYNVKIKVVGYETDELTAKKAQERLETLYPNVAIIIRIEDFISAVYSDEIEKFDYIIANPPYIRTQILGSEKAQLISKMFALQGRIDIYYAFLVCVKRVLKDTGIAGFITSNKFMTNKAGSAVRNYIIDNYKLLHIIDLGDTKLFDASVLPCLLFFKNGKTCSNKEVRFTSVYQTNNINLTLFGESDIPASIFDKINESGVFRFPNGLSYRFQQGTLQSIQNNELWTISISDDSEWLAKVNSNTYMTFSQLGTIRVGIKTTADNVFIGDNWDNENSNIELLRPLITHRNAGHILPNNTTKWQVLYTHMVKNGKKCVVDIDDYPIANAYLLKHQEQLAKRDYIKQANRRWYEIWVPQDPKSWSHNKIIFRDISEKPQFWYDSTGAIVNGDCYWIDIAQNVLDDMIYLALAIANSSFIEKYYDIRFNNRLYSGKRRFQKQYVEQFPLPYYGSAIAQKAISIVKKIIDENDTRLVSVYKEELDGLVNQLFLN